MRGIILAAGRGSRLNNLTDDKPKCMVDLRGKPLLSYQVNAFYQIGIQDIAIVCGYKSDRISPEFNLKKFYNDKWKNTNMVSSLLCAEDWLINSPCVVSYSDIFYEKSALESLEESVFGDISIVYDTNFGCLWSLRSENPLSDLETFQIGSDGFLKEIGGKPKALSEIEGQYMGLLKFNPSSWAKIKKIISKINQREIEKLDMTSLLSLLIKSNIKINPVPFSGIWGEVDTREDLCLYENNENFNLLCEIEKV